MTRLVVVLMWKTDGRVKSGNLARRWCYIYSPIIVFIDAVSVVAEYPVADKLVVVSIRYLFRVSIGTL